MDEARAREIKKKQYQTLLQAAGSGYRSMARNDNRRPPRGFAIVGGMHVPTSQNPVTASIVQPQSSLTAKRHAFAASPGIAMRASVSDTSLHGQARMRAEPSLAQPSLLSQDSIGYDTMIRSVALAHASDPSVRIGMMQKSVGEQILSESPSRARSAHGNRATVRGSTAEVAHRAALGRGRGGQLESLFASTDNTSTASPIRATTGFAASKTGVRSAARQQGTGSHSSLHGQSQAHGYPRTTALGASRASRQAHAHSQIERHDRLPRETEYDLPHWALPVVPQQAHGLPLAVRREFQRSVGQSQAQHESGGNDSSGELGRESIRLGNSLAFGEESRASLRSDSGALAGGGSALLPSGPTGVFPGTDHTAGIRASLRAAPLPPVIHLSREHMKGQLSSEESKVVMVQEWQESYAREQGRGFASPAIGLEAKLRRALVFSSAAEGRLEALEQRGITASSGLAGDPVELPTACAFEVLEDLEHHIGRYRPLLRLVRHVLARSVYEDGEAANDLNDDEEAFIEQIAAELSEAKRVALEEARVSGMNETASAVLASADYVRRLEAKLAGARSGVAGSNSLLRYYRLRPWFTSAERLTADKRRLARVISSLKGALVQWEEARQTELEGVRRRSVVVDKWKSAFNKSKQVSLKTQVLAISSQHHSQDAQISAIRSRLGTVDGCVDAYNGLVSDEDKLHFMRKSIEEVSPHLLKEILAGILGEQASVDTAVEQAASVVVRRKDAKHTDAVRMVSTVMREHFRQTMQTGMEQQEPSEETESKAIRQAADILVNAADAAGKSAIGMALPRLLRQLPEWQRGAAIRYLIGSDARVLSQLELHGLLEDNDTTLVDEGVVRIMKPGEYAMGLLRYIRGARTPAMLIGVAASSDSGTIAENSLPASGAEDVHEDEDETDPYDDDGLDGENLEQVVSMHGISDAEQGKLLRDLLDLMRGHAVESVVKAALEAHGPLRKPLRDDLGLEDRRNLIELLMHKLPPQRAISVLPLRIRTTIGQAKSEEIDAAAAAARMGAKRKVVEDPEAKSSPWRKYLKKAGARRGAAGGKRGPKVKKLNLTGALSIAYDIMEHKITVDLNDEEREVEPQNLCDYVRDYLLQKYGLPSIVDRNIVNLVEAVLKYQGASSRVRIFGKAIGVVDPGSFSYRLGQFVLALHRELFPRFKAVMLRHKREGHCQVQLTAALQAVMYVFPHKASSAFMHAERIRLPVEAQSRLQAALISMSLPVGQVQDDAGHALLMGQGGDPKEISAQVVGKLDLQEEEVPADSKYQGPYGGFKPASISTFGTGIGVGVDTEASSSATDGDSTARTGGAASEASGGGGSSTSKLHPETPVVDFDQLMQVCVAVFESRQSFEREVLSRLYDQYDDNGDGVLSAGEFSKIVNSMASATVAPLLGPKGNKGKGTGSGGAANSQRAAAILGLRRQATDGGQARRALTERMILQFFTEAHELSLEMAKDESGGFAGAPIAGGSMEDGDSDEDEDEGDVVLPMAFTRICDKHAIVPAPGMLSSQQ